MAVLEIRKFNDPVLRKKAKKVRVISYEIKQLAQDMIETIRDGNGIGLAGPQVGASERIIVVETDYKDRKVLALINPKIVKKSREKTIDTEGCLSFPGIYLEIKRAKEVEVKARNIEGKRIRLRAGGLLARTLQHEIDHLNGIVFYRRLSPVKGMVFRRKHNLK